MSVENIHQTPEELLAAQIFDRFAEAKRAGEVAQEIGYRAVAAAKIIAYTRGGESWFRLLDDALEERGVPSHYADLSPYKLRAQSRMASDALTPLTRRCRSVLQELEILNATSEDLL